MSSVESVVTGVTTIEPGWLLVLVLVGLACAMLLTMVRTWLLRHKHWQRYMTAAKAALQQGRYNEAEAMFRSLAKKAEEDFGAEDPKVASAIRSLALVYSLQGKYAVAEPLLYRSLAIMEKADPENIETSAALEQLARLYHTQGRYAATELILHRSLAIRERALGPDHPEVAKVLKQIAVLYKKVGKKDEAKRLEERTRAIH